MTPTDKQLETIARQHMSIETLEARNHDSLDFHTVSVWEVKAALAAAYEAGRATATNSPDASPAPTAEVDLVAALRENFTPHAVALIAAKQQPGYAKGPEAVDAERASAWFADRIIEMLGSDQYNALCEELGL
jgi:hypothetical protein